MDLVVRAVKISSSFVRQLNSAGIEGVERLAKARQLCFLVESILLTAFHRFGRHTMSFDSRLTLVRAIRSTIESMDFRRGRRALMRPLLKVGCCGVWPSLLDTMLPCERRLSQVIRKTSAARLCSSKDCRPINSGDPLGRGGRLLSERMRRATSGSKTRGPRTSDCLLSSVDSSSDAFRGNLEEWSFRVRHTKTR